MKKKLLLIILSLVCTAVCAAGLFACGKNSGDVEVTEISLDSAQITLTEGEVVTLIATVAPSDATDKTTVWSSSDKSVAMVESGSVIAVAEGEAVITVSSDNGVTATCAVTVEARQEEPPAQYSVTFYANGGRFASAGVTLSLQVNEDSKLPAVTVTRGEKYTFTGWYKNEARTQLWDSDNDTVKDDTSVYAGWEYENDYQPVIDALADRIKTERQDDGLEVEILSVFKNGDGKLCFVEKDGTGVFSYSTAIGGFTEVKDNAELISGISTTALTEIKSYVDTYTSDNDAYIADSMAYKYTDAANVGAAVVYSCVSEWQDDNGHFSSGGPFYSCTVKAIVADAYGNVFDCSFTVVAAVKDYSLVIGGSALSQDFDKTVTELGDIADDFYYEYVKANEA